jgi:hypothetical protein
VITSPEAFLNIKDTKKFCNGCKKPVSKVTHICETTGVFVKQLCLRCGEVHKNDFGKIICTECNREFVSEECFDNHKKTVDKVDSKGNQIYKNEYTYRNEYDESGEQVIISEVSEVKVQTKSVCEKVCVCTACGVICHNQHTEK